MFKIGDIFKCTCGCGFTDTVIKIYGEEVVGVLYGTFKISRIERLTKLEKAMS